MDFGIISLGNHALTRVIPAIGSSGSRVSHIYSTDSSKGERVSRELGAEYVPDLEKFVKQPFEAVYISSPNSLHFIHSKISLEAGKSVLLEKPVTLRNEDTETLSALAKRGNLRFNIGFHLRFHPAVEEVKKYIDEGKIGKPRIAFGKFTSNSTSSHDDTWWGKPEMAGGGSIVGRGVHVMDSFVNIFGRDVESLSAINTPRCKVIEDTMQVSIKFGSGVIANSLSSRIISSNSNDLTIYGNEGSLLVTNFYSVSVSSKLFVNHDRVKEYDKVTNMYEDEIRDFVHGGRKIAGPEDAVLSTRMHLFAQKAACTGESILLNDRENND